MRETLQKMQGTASVGSKRSKRRRQRKEERVEEQQLQDEMQELEAGVIEVLCPMRPQLVKYCGPRVLLLSELGQLQPRRPEKRHLV